MSEYNPRSGSKPEQPDSLPDVQGPPCPPPSGNPDVEREPLAPHPDFRKNGTAPPPDTSVSEGHEDASEGRGGQDLDQNE